MRGKNTPFSKYIKIAILADIIIVKANNTLIICIRLFDWSKKQRNRNL